MDRIDRMHGKDDKCIHGTDGRPKEKGQLRTLRCRWKYIIKVDLKETVCECVKWIQWLRIGPLVVPFEQ
jgi:hypothetical protein